jgi:hypothetical protein
MLHYFAVQTNGREMEQTRINRLSGAAPIAMSIAGYMLVLAAVAAQWRPDQADEGAAAHLFWLLMVGQVPITLIYLATADWNRGWAICRTLLFQALAVVIAFGAVFLAKL